MFIDLIGRAHIQSSRKGRARKGARPLP